MVLNMKEATGIKIPTMVIAAALILSGCAVKWGASYNVALQNSRSVVIEYDPTFINVPAMLNAAQQACSAYGKDAVLESTSPGLLGIVVNTYRCETRTADTVIDVQ